MYTVKLSPSPELIATKGAAKASSLIHGNYMLGACLYREDTPQSVVSRLEWVGTIVPNSWVSFEVSDASGVLATGGFVSVWEYFHGSSYFEFMSDYFEVK